MIEPELLAILACPESRQPLSIADDALLSKVNDRIAAGGATSVGGATLSEPWTAALVREDGQVCYPVRDDIPVLLVDEGLRVDG